MKWAKIAVTRNSLSAVLYALIFFISNKMVLDKDNNGNSINKIKEDEKIKINNE